MKYLKTGCFIGCGNNVFVQNIDEEPVKYKIKEIINSLIKDYYVRYFVSGVEFGFEQFAVETALVLKEEYSHLTIEAVLTYECFAANWDEIQRDKYYSIMQKIDKETLLQYHYSKDCIIKRNRYIINKSHYIVILCENIYEINDLITYAKSKQKALFIIDNALNNIPPLRILK